MVVESRLELMLRDRRGGDAGGGGIAVPLTPVVVVVFNHHGVAENQQPAASPHMRGMTPEQRQRFLDSPQLRHRFLSEEQNILRGLGRLFPGGDAPDR